MAQIESKNVVMTEEFVIQQCKKHHGYSTPELNKVLYLHHIGFTNISSLGAFHQCRVLYLNNNAIDSFDGLDQLQNLDTLYLANNALRYCKTLPALPALRFLDISSNSIESLEGLENAPNLDTLLASRNRVKTLNGLEPLNSLVTVDVSHNCISNKEDAIPLLANKTTVRSCMFHGNRFVVTMPDYRKRIVSEMPLLRFLDKYPVFPQERSCAEAFASGGAEAESLQRAENQRREEQERSEQFSFFGKIWREFQGRQAQDGVTRTPTAYFDDNNTSDIFLPQQRK